MNRPTRTLPPLEPYDMEVREVTYVDWLLAGGAPIPQPHADAWAKTQPGGLEAGQ